MRTPTTQAGAEAALRAVAEWMHQQPADWWEQNQGLEVTGPDGSSVMAVAFGPPCDCRNCPVPFTDRPCTCGAVAVAVQVHRDTGTALYACGSCLRSWSVTR